jgi:peptidyl-prolyl cis-trans isomerase B (cyclophilin B)
MNDTVNEAPLKKNGLATASLIIAIVSIVPILSLGNIFGFIEGVVAVILGSVAASQIKKTNQPGKGMSTAGIIIGVVGSIVPFIVIVILRLLGPQIGEVFNRINQSLSAV